MISKIMHSHVEPVRIVVTGREQEAIPTDHGGGDKVATKPAVKIDYESLLPVPPTKRQKLRRHCTKHWKWYALGTVIFLAILIPTFLLVVLPAIAQRIVGDMSLPIYSVAIRALGPEECELTINTGLSTPAGIGINMRDSLLHLYNIEDDSQTSFLDLVLPGQGLEGETNITIDRQKVAILDEDGFAEFLGNVFRGTEAVLGIRGKIKASIGKLPPTNLELDKKVTVTGLNSLQGFSFEDVRPGLLSEPNRLPVSGSVNIPVSGDIELVPGNVTFEILADPGEEGSATEGLVIGEVKTTDMVLAPGNNSIPFFGDIFIDVVRRNPGTILRSQAGAIGNGEIELVTIGKMVEVSGERIPWLESVLATQRLVSRIPIGTLLRDLLAGGANEGALGDILRNSFDLPLKRDQV